MRKIKYLIILLILTVGIMSAGFSFGATDNTEEINKINKEIEARKNKIKEMEKTIDNYNKQINAKRAESASLKNQISVLDNRTAQLEVDIELTETKIDKTELEIGALELSIKDKENDMDRQKKVIKKIIQNLHSEGEKNYIEILLTNDNLAQFYSQVKNLESVYTDLGRSVKNLRLTKEDLDKKKTDVEARKKSYSDLKDQLVGKKQDLADEANYRSSLLAQTQSSELKYKSLLASLRSQYQQIENEIKSYEDQARKLLEAKKNTVDLGDPTKMSWPVPSRYITAVFHDATYVYRNVFEHNAIDIRASYGTPVKAAASGYVARAKTCSLASCYSYILIVHDDDLATAYGHLSKIIVSEDQFIQKGDIIGYSGGTPGTIGAGPFTTAAHLHFEVRKNGIPVNPVNYLPSASN